MPSFRLRIGFRRSLLLAILLASCPGLWAPPQERLRARRGNPGRLAPLASAEFARLVATLSEDDGYFRSDNFTSNETSYLHIVGKLAELGISGGAYIGVGPEQNLSYIAKIRPAIAFIVDIRRQAVLQHLLYKVAFHVSETRAQFLSVLLSRPLVGAAIPPGYAPVEQLLAYFAKPPAPAADEAYKANLARVRKMIENTFSVPLSEKDRSRLEYILSAFRGGGLDISFRFASWDGSGGFGGYRGYGGFPSLRDLIMERDLDGNLGNFLATEDDYRFVRSLQLSNRIIPVVGDVSGPRALAGVGEYLRKHGYTVRAFYLSNVEQYLFQNGVYAGLVQNLRKLPVDDASVIIRSVSGRGQPHPANVGGHRTTTIMQRIPVLLKDYEAGRCSTYRDLVMIDYIAALKGSR